MTSTTRVDIASVRAEIAEIVDPCSMSTEHPVSIVELGLVREVDVRDDGVVHVRLGTTGPGCLYYPELMRAIENAVGALPGVALVRVELDKTFVWDESAMGPEARRRREAVLLGNMPGLAKPQAWKRPGHA